MSRIKSSYLIVFVLAILVFGVLNIINGRFEMYDYQVYFGAWEQMMQGESPYGQSFGLSSGYYKYAPAPALLLTPLFILGWSVSKYVYWILLAVSMVVVPIRIKRQIGDTFSWDPPKSDWILWLSVILVGGHFFRELLLGNVNWLLFLGLYAVFQYRGKSFLSGALFGIILLFKPHFVFLIPWFVLRGYWKVLFASFFAIAMGLLFPAVFIGWETNIKWIGEWFGAMQMHNMNLWESANTVYHFLDSLTFKTINGQLLIAIGLVLASSLILVMLIRNKRAERDISQLKYSNEFFEYFLILAFIPNLVHTDTEHFLWSFPIIIIFAFWIMKNPTWWKWILFVGAMIPFTLATPDIWGREGAEWIIKSGTIGVANLLMIAVAIMQHIRNKSLHSS
ncbi:MAG: DUF2029 domain-containing protein [Flavobacteriales bacterium]|nr:DUF2029 domain-containing protein [Flavobacteriales bacterium]